MHHRAAILTLAALACAVLPARGNAATATCGSSAYSYAGVLSVGTSHGVGATITPLHLPAVRQGHVAAWVGVGGVGLGPNGTSEWLQVGISAQPSRGVALYYELALPGAAPRYVMLGRPTAGRSVRVAVLESPERAGSWHVLVNGRRVTGQIHLPGSHGAWRPVATTENWNGGAGVCNQFAFRFTGLRSAARPGGKWRPMVARVLNAPGARVLQRTRVSFTATAGF